MKRLASKLAALTLSAVLVVTTCMAGFVSASDILFDLKSLGVTEGFDYGENLNANVTRGEFARLVVNLMGQQEAAKAINSEIIFADSASNPHNGAINLLYKQGIVSGAGNGMYLPDRFVGLGEACKILVNILGYSPAVADKSSLSSYIYTAGNIGVTKGVSASSGSLTVKEVLTLLYNCLDIDRMVAKYYGSNLPASYEIDEGNTFRKSIGEATPSGGLVKLRGIVTADVTTYLNTQKSGMRDSQIEVDGVVFNYSGVAPTGLVGLQVEMFATTYADGEYDKITAITVTDKNTVTNVIGEDIKSFTSTSLKYDVNENGKNSQEVKLNASTKYIYNNNIDRNFNPSSVSFDTKTQIRAIDNDGDEIADVVFIFVYEDRIVDSVNTERKVVTLSSAVNGAVNLDFDPDNTKNRVEYFSADGKKSDFSQIAADDCLSLAISKDGYSIRVVISKEKISGAIQSKDGDYVTVGGVEYRTLADASSYRVGTNVKLWLNYRNEIVKIEEKSYYEDGSTNFAYIYNTGKQGGNLGTAQIKVLVPNSLSAETTEVVDTETGEITRTGKLAANNADTLVYYLAKKVRVNGVSRQSSESSLLGTINHRAVRYTLDSEGKVNSIDFLDTLKDYVRDSVTGEFVTNPDGSYKVKTETVSKTMKYSSSEKVFGAANCLPFGIDDKSVAVCVPTQGGSVASVDDDSLLNFKFTLEDKYTATVSAYETDDDTHIAKFVVFEFAASSMNVGNMPEPKAEKKYVGMVLSSGYSLDENGDEVMTFDMLTIGNGSGVTEQKLNVSSLISSNSSFASIGKGDLALYSLDDFGRINNIKLVKDFSDRNTDRIANQGTNYETYCYTVKSIDFDEIDNNNVRWVDKLVVYSLQDPNGSVGTFNMPHLASLSPIVFIVDAKGEATLGTAKDICYGDRVCVYNPRDFSNVAAVVIYR